MSFLLVTDPSMNGEWKFFCEKELKSWLDSILFCATGLRIQKDGEIFKKNEYFLFLAVQSPDSPTSDQRHNLTNKKTNTFRDHLLRAVLETCDL